MISLWRALIAVLAWTGVWLGLDGGGPGGSIGWFNLAYFTQVCGVLVALTATGSLLRPLWHRGENEGRHGYVRGGVAACSMLTLIVFATLLGADYSSGHSLLLHLVVPLLATADWLCVGRNQTALPFWVPLTWLLIPLGYLPVYLWASNLSGPLYGFLLPGHPSFVPIAVVMLAGFVVLFFAYWGLGRLRGVIVRRREVAS